MSKAQSDRARLGGLTKSARYDSKEQMIPVRAGFAKRFLDEVDPLRQLPEAERERRAAAARKLHFHRLSYLSARARARK